MFHPDFTMDRSIVTHFYFFLIAVASTTLFSCGDDEVIPTDSSTGYTYFPLKQSSWIIYDVDSIVHLDNDDAFGQDTSVERYDFQIREIIDSSFIDGEQDTAWRVSRYKRLNDSLPWEFQNVWVSKRTLVNAQRVENNIRFVKLAFPPTLRATWNGNAYNYFPSEEYFYDNIHTPLQLQGLTFDSTLTVIQNDFQSNVNRIVKKEKYAAGVGLIEKDLDSLRLTINFGGLLILNGLEYSQKINSFGQ